MVKVRVSNFQSISKAEIDIDRFTVVTGPNSLGKTALLRGIRGVFQNTGGTAFIRHGETKCSVLVDFGADGRVEWSKGTGKRDRPTYIINDGDPIYPGSAVPDEVAAFGVVPIQAGGQEIWPSIAAQFTGPVFLLDRPGSVLAEAVADVERVGQLNRALRQSESDRRHVAATLKVRQSDMAQYEAEVKAFEGLDEALAAVQDLEDQREQLVRVQRATEGLMALKRQLDDAHKEARRLSPAADVVVPVADTATKFWEGLCALRDLQARWKHAQQEVQQYQGIDEVQIQDLDEQPIQRLLAALDVLLTLRNQLQAANQEVTDQEQALEMARQELEAASAGAVEALEELGNCPTCGTQVAGP